MPEELADLPSATDRLGQCMTSDLRRDVAVMLEHIDGILAGIQKAHSAKFEGSNDAENVSAVVTGAGDLVGLEIAPDAMRDLDAQELATACKEAILDARLGLARSMTETIKNVAGVDLDHSPASTGPLDAWRQAMKESGWSR
jgi:DNA-binding protein YbaB